MSSSSSLVMTVQDATSCEEAEKERIMEEAAGPDGLEEGECSDDEEQQQQQQETVAVAATSVAVAPQPLKEHRSEKERKSKRSRSRSREKHRSRKHKKRKDKKQGDGEEEKPMDEEAKKRALLKKLKALEGEMGLMPDESEEEEEDEAEEFMMDEQEMVAGQEMEYDESDPKFLFGERKRKRSDKEMMAGLVKKRRICNLFMQGKCPRPEEECLFSHDAEPPQVWELCKFYLFDRCVKKEKCLYLHKGFPCKYFHTGLDCKDDSDTCKFSHEPLNDMTRNLLLKHLETAPKEILGDFPRMNRAEAATTVYRVEALNSGWSLPGPDRRLGWADQQQAVPRHWDARRGPGGMMQPAGWDNMNPAGMPAGNTWAERQQQQQQHGPPRQPAAAAWTDRKAGEPPLAVQQALAMEGRNADFGGGQGGIQAHEVLRTRTAFNNSGPAQKKKVTGSGGILGPSPPQPATGAAAAAKPTGLMEVKINEDMVAQFLHSQRDLQQDQKEEEEEGGPAGGDETPDVTPPVSRETTPVPSDPDFEEEAGDVAGTCVKEEAGAVSRMPPVQLKLFQRIQNKERGQQEVGTVSGETGAVGQVESEKGEQEAGKRREESEDEYGDDDDEDDKNVIVNVLKRLEGVKNSPDGSPSLVASTPPLHMTSLPKELTSMLAAISSVKTGPAESSNQLARTEQPVSPTQQPPSSADSPAAQPAKRAERRPDPRRERQAQREEEERLERERDQRILDLDLGSVFGDLELPPLPPSPQQTEQEKLLSDSLGLPFKPHIYQVAKEIEAGLNSHPPMEWVLRVVSVPRPNYSQLRHHCSPAQLELDPRLRRYSARTSMAKLKELPLPAPGPAPKTDPRLKGRVDPRRQAPPAGVAPSATDVERRRSSEDGDGNFVYNPAKELSRAKQAAAAQQGAKTSGGPWPAAATEEQANTFIPEQGEEEQHQQAELPYSEEEAAWLEEQAQFQQNPGQQFFQPAHGRFNKESPDQLMEAEFGGGSVNQRGFGKFANEGRAALMQQQHNYMMHHQQQQLFHANFQGQAPNRGFGWNQGAIRQPQFGRGSFRSRGEFRGGRPPFN